MSGDYTMHAASFKGNVVMAWVSPTNGLQVATHRGPLGFVGSQGGWNNQQTLKASSFATYAGSVSVAFVHNGWCFLHSVLQTSAITSQWYGWISKDMGETWTVLTAVTHPVGSFSASDWYNIYNPSAGNPHSFSWDGYAFGTGSAFGQGRTILALGSWGGGAWFSVLDNKGISAVPGVLVGKGGDTNADNSGHTQAGFSAQSVAFLESGWALQGNTGTLFCPVLPNEIPPAGGASLTACVFHGFGGSPAAMVSMCLGPASSMITLFYGAGQYWLGWSADRGAHYSFMVAPFYTDPAPVVPYRRYLVGLEGGYGAIVYFDSGDNPKHMLTLDGGRTVV